MDRLDQLLDTCAKDVESIAASTTEIIAASNRLQAEMSTNQRSGMTLSAADIYRQCSEHMLNILIEKTKQSKAANLKTNLSATLPHQFTDEEEISSPNRSDVAAPVTAVELQVGVQNKCRQIRKTEAQLNIINEVIQKEIVKSSQ